MVFYLYGGFRVVPIIIGVVFAKELIGSNRKLLLLRQALFLLLGFIILSWPQFNFYLHNPGVFNSRINSVFIFSQSAEATEWRDGNYREQTPFQILTQQIKKTFLIAKDTSGQYGYPYRLLDWSTITLLIVGIIISIKNFRQNRHFLLLVWFFLSLFIGEILTTDPFFLPRATGLLPAIFIFVAIALEAIINQTRKISSKLSQTLFFFSLILLIVVTTWNLKTYFIDSEKELWGDPNKYTAIKIVNYLNQIDTSYNAVFLTVPRLYADFGPISFLAKPRDIVDIEKPGTYQSTLSPKTIFIIRPEYSDIMAQIQSRNPGVLTPLLNNQNQIELYCYLSN
jgi:hypothetical protein